MSGERYQKTRIINTLGVAESINERVGLVVMPVLYILAAIILYEVVARYVFDSPTLWAGELSMMLFGAISLLGGGYVLLRGGHTNVNILHKRLPLRARAIVDLFTAFFFFLFCGALMWQGTEMFCHSMSYWEHSSSVWGPPMYPARFLIPLGAALILLQGLVKFIKDVITAIGGQVLQ